MIKILFAALTASLISSISFAQTSGKSKRFLFEVNTLFGWGSSQTSTDVAVPAIGAFNLELAAGFNVKRLSLGAAYDYRILTQFTEVDPTVGNRRGTFVSPVSIFVRLNFEKIKFGFMMINSGTYELTNKTVTDQKLAYTQPSGFRFDIIFRKFSKITPMIHYESVAFSGMQLDGVDSTPASKLTFSNFGAGIKYDF